MLACNRCPAPVTLTPCLPCRFIASGQRGEGGHGPTKQTVRQFRRGRARHSRRRGHRVRRLRHARRAVQPDQGAARAGCQEPDLRRQHHGRRAAAAHARHRHAGGERPGEEGDLRLHRGDARLRRAALHQILRVRRGRGGAGAAGHAGRTAARRRRRHPRLLHADRGRHRAGRGPRDPGDQRARIPAGIRAAGGLRLRARHPGRHVRQPAIPSRAAEFQPGDGDRGARHHRRGGRGHPAGRRDRSGRGASLRHLRASAGAACRRRPRGSGHRNGRSAADERQPGA